LRLLDESSRDSGGEPEPPAEPAPVAASAPVTVPSSAPSSAPNRGREEEEDVLLDG
jgi:hypothetical protein